MNKPRSNKQFILLMSYYEDLKRGHVEDFNDIFPLLRNIMSLMSWRRRERIEKGLIEHINYHSSRIKESRCYADIKHNIRAIRALTLCSRIYLDLISLPGYRRFF